MSHMARSNQILTISITVTLSPNPIPPQIAHMPSQKNTHTQNSFKVNSSPPNHRPNDNLTGNKFPNNHPSIIQQCRQRISRSRSRPGRGKFPPRRRASGTLLRMNQSTRRLVLSLTFSVYLVSGGWERLRGNGSKWQGSGRKL